MDQDRKASSNSSFDTKILMILSKLPEKMTAMEPMEQIQRPSLSQHPIRANEVTNSNGMPQKPVLKQNLPTQNTTIPANHSLLRNPPHNRSVERRLTIVAETEDYIDSINRRLQE
jgi:hypothetical protein